MGDILLPKALCHVQLNSLWYTFKSYLLQIEECKTQHLMLQYIYEETKTNGRKY